MAADFSIRQAQDPERVEGHIGGMNCQSGAGMETGAHPGKKRLHSYFIRSRGSWSRGSTRDHPRYPRKIAGVSLVEKTRFCGIMIRMDSRWNRCCWGVAPRRALGPEPVERAGRRPE